MELKTFNFNQNQVTVFEKNGEPWFVLNEVCSILEIANSRDVKNRLNQKGVDTTDIPTLGGIQKTTIINEPNLYKVIFQSRKEEATKFSDWVTEDVLPSIRKNGGYIANQEKLTPEQIVANALVVAHKIIEDNQRQIETMKPKADFYDAVAGSKDAIDIGTVAKVLNIPNLGRNKLFEILREKQILMKDNQPYQKYIDQGYFRTVEQKYTTPDGEIKISIKTLVYQKGLDFIRKAVENYVIS